MTQKILFVGGSLDGEWKTFITDPPPIIEIPIQSRCLKIGENLLEKSPFEVEVYRLSVIWLEPQSILFFRRTELSTQEAVITLMKGYKGTSKEEKRST